MQIMIELGLELPDEALGLPALEAAVRTWGLAVMRRMLAAAWARQAGLRAAAVPAACPACASPDLRPAGAKPRAVETTFGPVRLSRQRRRCRACGRHHQPDDAALGPVLGAGRCTPALREMAAWAGASWPYRAAATMLGKWRGAPLSPETVRAVVATAGAAVAAQHAAEAEAAACPPATAPAQTGRTPARLEAVLDGGWVRSRDNAEGMEAKVAVVHTGSERVGRTRTRLTNRRYAATLGGVGRFGPLVTAAVEHHDGYACPDQTLLGDGAAWIWSLGATVLGAATPVLDRWHLSDARRRALRRAVPEAAERAPWTARVEACLDVGDVAGAAAALAELAAPGEGAAGARPPAPAAPPLGPAEQRALAEFAAYLHEQAPRIPDYAARRAAGRTIGSGAIEKGVDVVVNRRLKGRRGMKWWRERAEGVLALRVAQLNGEWDRRLAAALAPPPKLPAF